MTENETIIAKLKILKGIEPDPKYAESSRHILMSRLSRPAFSLNPAEALKFAFSLILAASFVVILFVSNAALQRLFFPLIFPGLNTKSMAAELENLEIQIKIAEAEYYTGASKTVAVALGEAAYNVNHLNSALIQREVRFPDTESPTNDKIDQILNDLL